MTGRLPRWLLLNVAALTFALAHVFVDLHIGLFGETSALMTPLQAANILVTCLLVGWWSVSLALAAGDNGQLLSGVLALSVGWAFLGNGLVAAIASPPPSTAFPYQDITHFGSLIFGALAAQATWREMRARDLPFNWQVGAWAIGLMVVAFVISSILTLSNL